MQNGQKLGATYNSVAKIDYTAWKWDHLFREARKQEANKIYSHRDRFRGGTEATQG